jgi:DNA-binding NarL/FixJ family response regulator
MVGTVGMQATRPVRIFVGEDHHLVREGVVALLRTQPDFRIVGGGETSREIVRGALELEPDIVVLDVLLLNDLSGIEILRQLRPKLPRTRFVMLSMHADAPYVIDALQHGASAYVLKQSSSDELVRAVRAARAGAIYLSPPLSHEKLELYRARTRHDTSDPFSTLTTREREVLQLVAQGLSNAGIGNQLGIGRRTVESHRQSGMNKLDLKNLAQLLEFFYRRGLIPSSLGAERRPPGE